MIKKTSRKTSVGTARTSRITASSNITSAAKNRQARKIAASYGELTPQKRIFARQLQNNVKHSVAVTAATNTTNIMARPDFLELLPMFVQKLLILDVYGSVAMKSRQQLIPYFKFIAENTKGETKRGDVLSSPFVNRQGIDPNFGGRVIKNEVIGEGAALDPNDLSLVYGPVLPGSITIQATLSGDTTLYTDDGNGKLVDAAGADAGYVD